jgi:hypothetical protein
MLSAAEFLRRLYFKLQGFDFRTLLQCLLNQRSNVSGRNIDRSSLFDKLEILLVGVSENRREARQRSLVVVLSLQ